MLPCRKTLRQGLEEVGVEEAQPVSQHPRELAPVQAAVQTGRPEVGAGVGVQVHRPPAVCNRSTYSG